MRETRTSGLMSGDGKRSDWQCLKPPRPSSTLPSKFESYMVSQAVRSHRLDFALVVKKLRHAGAIILAKMNMSEFASASPQSSLGCDRKADQGCGSLIGPMDFANAVTHPHEAPKATTVRAIVGAFASVAQDAVAMTARTDIG
jgi:Amidase